MVLSPCSLTLAAGRLLTHRTPPGEIDTAYTQNYPARASRVILCVLARTTELQIDAHLLGEVLPERTAAAGVAAFLSAEVRKLVGRRSIRHLIDELGLNVVVVLRSDRAVGLPVHARLLLEVVHRHDRLLEGLASG